MFYWLCIFKSDLLALYALYVSKSGESGWFILCFIDLTLYFPKSKCISLPMRLMTILTNCWACVTKKEQGSFCMEPCRQSCRQSRAVWPFRPLHKVFVSARQDISKPLDFVGHNLTFLFKNTCILAWDCFF